MSQGVTNAMRRKWLVTSRVILTWRGFIWTASEIDTMRLLDISFFGVDQLQFLFHEPKKSKVGFEYFVKAM